GVGALHDGDVRHEPSAVVAAFDGTRWRVGGRDELAARTRGLLLDMALPHEVARHVLVEEGLLAAAERAVGGAATRRALALIVTEVVDHGLAAQLLLQRGALPPPCERTKLPRLGIVIGLILAQLLLRGRHLLRLGTKHAARERLHRRRDRSELAA